LIRAIDQHMIALGVPGAIMDLFAAKQQHISLLVITEIAFDAIYPDVVIGEDEKIQPDQQRGFGSVRMISCAVRIGGMDVEITNVFAGGHRHQLV
jgi:hypothetical protein